MNAIGRKKEPESHDGEENKDRFDPHRVIESWPSNFNSRPVGSLTGSTRGIGGVTLVLFALSDRSICWLC
jgi:hypothetical protein